MKGLQCGKKDLALRKEKLTMTACFRVSVLDPTDVPNAFATSLAPVHNSATRHISATRTRSDGATRRSTDKIQGRNFINLQQALPVPQPNPQEASDPCVCHSRATVRDPSECANMLPATLNLATLLGHDSNKQDSSSNIPRQPTTVPMA